jgi:hypothetical protein
MQDVYRLYTHAPAAKLSKNKIMNTMKTRFAIDVAIPAKPIKLNAPAESAISKRTKLNVDMIILQSY